MVAILPLRQLPDPILRQRARRVREIDGTIHRLVRDMIETMHDADGVGLAAPQVGIPLRVVVIEIPDEREVRVLINPEVMRTYGERVVEEGCLSIPGYRGTITRSVRVRVRAVDLTGKEVRIKADNNLLAQALQHETDHVRGQLYIDYLESAEHLYRLADLREEASNGPRDAAGDLRDASDAG